MAKATAMMMLVALALVLAVAASAQKCDVSQLSVCAPAVINGSPPTAACCDNLKAQEPCFCQYASDPTYSSYINSANARKTLASCKIATPNC